MTTVTACARNQAEADAVVPGLLAQDADRRVLLLCPMEGAVDLTRPENYGNYRLDALRGQLRGTITRDIIPCSRLDGVVIRGGERPLHPQWVRDARDACAAAGVAFSFLGWGEWIPRTQTPAVRKTVTKWGCLSRSGGYMDQTTTWNGKQEQPEHNYEVTVALVGASASGRLLDGELLDGVDGAAGLVGKGGA